MDKTDDAITAEATLGAPAAAASGLPIRVLVASRRGGPLDAVGLLPRSPDVCLLNSRVAAPALLVPALGRQRPDVLLLDGSIWEALDALQPHLLHTRFPQLRVLLVGRPMRPGLPEEVIRCRFHGVLPPGCSAETRLRAVRAVSRGEYWLSRAWMSRALDRWIDEGGDASGLESGLAGRSCVHAVGALTRREDEIAGCLGQGLTNKEIARRLGITEDTVKKHLQGVFGKLGVRRRTLVALNQRALRAA